MDINAILDLAAKHVPSESVGTSANVCLQDARSLAARGELDDAARRAIKSLIYSVGVDHDDTFEAVRLSMEDFATQAIDPPPANDPWKGQWKGYFIGPHTHTAEQERLFQEAQTKANELSYMLTNLINATPTGDKRNALTEANIHCHIVEASLKTAARIGFD